MNITRFSGFVFAVLSVAVIVIANTGVSHAADPGFCAQYARSAVRDVKVNMATPGCFKGFDGRWHTNYQRHYGWCLTASYAAVNAERDYRRMRLAQCQGR